MIKIVDVGWAAGFYEGEGSFIKNHVSITQKDIQPLEKIQKLFGGDINLYGGYYYWRIYGVQCRGFVLTIFSMLSPRRKQQILEYKEFFNIPDKCPNGHEYVQGSFFYEESRGQQVRVCITCREAKMERRNDPNERLANKIAKMKGITIDEAKKLLIN